MSRCIYCEMETSTTGRFICGACSILHKEEHQHHFTLVVEQKVLYHEGLFGPAGVPKMDRLKTTHVMCGCGEVKEL